MYCKIYFFIRFGKKNYHTHNIDIQKQRIYNILRYWGRIRACVFRRCSKKVISDIWLSAVDYDNGIYHEQ